MKLIDILVRDLHKYGGWPERAAECHRFVDEAHIDFYDKDGNWPEDCFLKYGPFAQEAVRERKSYRASESVTREQYEAALAAAQPQWDGEGLPPVGVNIIVTPHNSRWGFTNAGDFTGKVISYDGEDFWFKMSNGIKIVSRTDKVDFRPIPSEADKKRDEVEKGIAHALFKDGDFDWDESLRLATFVYGAISIGGIPHIRIE